MTLRTMTALRHWQELSAFLLNVFPPRALILNVFRLSVILLNGVKPRVFKLSIFILSVVLVSVFMLNVIIQKVVAPRRGRVEMRVSEEKGQKGETEKRGREEE